MKNLWLDAMEFLDEFYFVLSDPFFDLYMEIVSKLNHLKGCIIHNSLPSEKLLKIVNVFPKLPNLTLNGEMDDEVLKLLASKSNKSNALKELTLVPAIGFSIDALEHFFKRATFLDESQIDLKINAAWPDVEEMFKRIGKYEVSLRLEEETEVWLILKKINENICITVSIFLNL
uniref:Uncharacterized protein n=1 Tax=Panagrolaimus sp. JU765 TaxID=591449 RepID=A0AC34RPN6_9BILA